MNTQIFIVITILLLILGAIIAGIILIINKKPDQNKKSIPPEQKNYIQYPVNKPQITTQQNTTPIHTNQIPQQQTEIYPYRKKYLLTKFEYYFYNKLKEVTAPLNLQILAKIRLADLIEVDTYQAGKEYMKYFGKIKAKHIDFAICNNMNIIALLELDDSSHQKDARKERDNFVNNALQKAGYTVIRTNGNLDEIKKVLNDKGYKKSVDYFPSIGSCSK